MKSGASFFSKLTVCIVLGLLAAGAWLLLGTDLNSKMNPAFIFLAAGLSLLLGLVYPFIWQIREKKKLVSSSHMFIRMQVIICYLLAFCISLFGWKKIFRLQFRVPMSFADQPMSAQSGEWLTWYYFGYSYTFAYVVGIIQIAGAIMLLFRRTRLAGVMILFPVMLNILLINIFYGMNAGALLQSAIYAIGLLFLLLTEYGRLVDFFFPVSDTALPARNKVIQNMLRFSVLLIAALIVASASTSRKQDRLLGVYDVKSLKINQQLINTGSVRVCDSVLTRIYFDLDSVCVLEFNGADRRLVAKYQSDPIKHTIRSIFSTGKGHTYPFEAIIKPQPHNELQITGALKEDSVEIEALKIR